MKKRYQLILLNVLAFGLLGALLRFWLLHSGYDDRKLLVPFHPASVLCWLVTLCAVAVLVYLTIRIHPLNRYARVFPASIPAAVGCLLAAVGIGVRCAGLLRTSCDFLGYGAFGTGMLSIAALCWCAYCRFRGKCPGCYPMGIVTIYFMLLLIHLYRTWLTKSQPEEYIFSLALHVLLMLTSYHRASLDGGGKNLRLYLRYAMVTLFFACTALPGSQERFFTVTIALYLAAELFCLRLPAGKKPQKEGT